ncbi:hypothetical protein [Burkholderia sp. LMG 32019]|uniref:hypothetical protein n=1 Tax=Burkholderia sp. LMG 32019 TaxID=3158173 RepID=UPI003C2DD2E6
MTAPVSGGDFPWLTDNWLGRAPRSGACIPLRELHPKSWILIRPLGCFLLMVANAPGVNDVRNPHEDIVLPESVVSLFDGEPGFPQDGIPAVHSRTDRSTGTARL